MAVIRTKRNIVCALDPLPGDTFVQTLLGTPSGQRVLSTHPIADYDASVAWAVAMARASMGLPQNALIFLRGMRLLPPRAGIIQIVIYADACCKATLSASITWSCKSSLKS